MNRLVNNGVFFAIILATFFVAIFSSELNAQEKADHHFIIAKNHLKEGKDPNVLSSSLWQDPRMPSESKNHLTIEATHPALCWACYRGRLDLVRLFIDHGANFEKADSYGMTPLMLTAGLTDFSLRLAIARLLIKNGAIVDGHSKHYGQSTLTIAAEYSHVKLVRLLLCNGADTSMEAWIKKRDPKNYPQNTYDHIFVRQAQQENGLKRECIEKIIQENQYLKNKYPLFAARALEENGLPQVVAQLAVGMAYGERVENEVRQKTALEREIVRYRKKNC